MKWIDNIISKLNPAQDEIFDYYGEDHPTTSNVYTTIQAYEGFSSVSRGVDLIIDSVAPVSYDIKEMIVGGGTISIKPKKLNTIINYKPNEYQSSLDFKSQIVIDYLLDGNAFIYYDGRYLYNLPASSVEVIADKKTFVNHYTYGDQKFYPDEIIHIKDNSARSIYRGDSRLKSVISTITLLDTMYTYHQRFFDNNAIPGLVISTPDILSTKIKRRTLDEWSQMYRPSSGGKRPMLLDGNMKLENLGHTDLRSLDFSENIVQYEEHVLEALGVPPILLSSGNNANITPNVRLFYLQTVLPIANKIAAQFEHFFGYDLKPVTGDILALKSDLKDEANYYSTLVNNGIMKGCEAREALRLEKCDDPELDKIRVPANIAGSATDSNQGGAPSKEEDK